jgi:hypothetical protein
MSQPRDQIDDKSVCIVFSCHRDYTIAFEGEIKVWIEDNWPKWIRDKPVWFTKEFVACIPDSVLSEDARREMYSEDEQIVKKRWL